MKNIVKNNSAELKINWHNWSLMILYQDCPNLYDLLKNMVPGGRASFPYRIGKSSSGQKLLSIFGNILAQMVYGFSSTQIAQM